MRTTTGLLIAIAATFIFGFLSSNSAQGAEGPPQTEVEALRQKIVAAMAAAKNGNSKAAGKALVSAIESHSFSKLDEPSRHRVVSFAGSLFLSIGDIKQARRYLEAATEMRDATLSDWYGRLVVSSSRGDMEDSVKCLLHISSHWPKEARDLPEKTVAQIVEKIQGNAASSEQYFLILDALSKTDWPAMRFWADNYWKQLALFHLNNGNQKRAQEVAARISSPDTLVAMRVNKKYEALVVALPERFDIDKAIAGHVEYVRALANAEPNSLEKVTLLASALKEARRYEEAVEVAARAIERAASDPKAFVDARDNLRWTMNLNAGALIALNRPGWIELMKKAAAIPEVRGRNVSQAINLGLMHCWFGDASLARGAIRQLSFDNISPYGKMALEGVRLCADIIEKNRNEIDRRLAAMREQRRIAPGIYRNSLLRADKLGEAAAFIQEALADPKMQDQMLFELQEFKPGTAGLPLSDAVDDALREVVKRPDVRRAIDAIGKIESYEFDPSY